MMEIGLNILFFCLGKDPSEIGEAVSDVKVLTAYLRVGW